MRSESGQATVEAALTFPVVLIALLLIVQVGIVVRDVLALHQAAREGVRTAAISADDDAAVESIRNSAGPLAADRIEIDIEPDPQGRTRGRPISIRLRYAERLRIPIVSRIVDLELPLKASATMRLERAYASPSPRPP